MVEEGLDTSLETGKLEAEMTRSTSALAGSGKIFSAWKVVAGKMFLISEPVAGKILPAVVVVAGN